MTSLKFKVWSSKLALWAGLFATSSFKLRTSNSAARATTAALIAALLFGAGCGVPGAPLPPLLNVPQPAEIRAEQQGEKVVLHWQLPRLTTEGQAIRPDRLGSAEIYRAILPGLRREVAANEFQAHAEVVASIAPAQLHPGAMQYVLPLPLGNAGSTAAYGIRLSNQRGHDAGFSNIVAVPVIAPTSPPAALSLSAAEQAIVLEWPPVSGASSYHVYRAEGEGPMQLKAQVPSSANPPTYRDPDFEFGKEYRYAVRAVRSQDGASAESLDSPVKSIQAKDEFPPKVPGGLVALAATGAVELSWEPNPEADLAGYNVYRSEAGGTPAKVNNALVVSPAYRDANVRSGANYSYQVTAVDRAGNESARPASVAATP